MNYWNWNSNVMGQSQSSNNNHHKSNKSEFLNSLVGKNVKINRGGPDSIQGNLLAVKSDCLVMNTNEGVVYVSTSHVKSMTEITGNKNNKSGRRDPEYVNASNFNGVIRSFNHKFAQINWGGPEKVEGFVAEVGNQGVMLVTAGQEVLQMQLFHIKTIKAAGKNQSGGNKSGSNNNNNKSNSNKSNSNKSNSNKNNSKNSNKNKNNKSNGNRSGGQNSGGNRSGGKNR